MFSVVSILDDEQKFKVATMKPTNRKYPAGYIWLSQHFDHKGDDCLIWPFACCTAGYGTFQYQQKKQMAHRAMCQQRHGPSPDPSYHAAHSCGNRRCVNPAHLTWKSQADNQLDRRAHGTNNKTRTKITALQADQIRKLKGIETSIETAARYGVTESNVRLIQDGKTWGPRVHHLWTPEEDARLRAALDAGHPLRTVAEMVGHKFDSVTARIYRLGLGARSGHHACKSLQRS